MSGIERSIRHAFVTAVLVIHIMVTSSDYLNLLIENVQVNNNTQIRAEYIERKSITGRKMNVRANLNGSQDTNIF